MNKYQHKIYRSDCYYLNMNMTKTIQNSKTYLLVLINWNQTSFLQIRNIYLGKKLKGKDFSDR